MTYLARTNGTATSTTTFTISTWVKRSELAGDRYVFSIANNNGVAPTEHIHLRFASDKLQSQFYISSSQVGQIETNAVYRDSSSWYHIVFRFDSTQSTANDRMRLYINGEETSLGTQTMPSQNASCAACSGGRFTLSTSYSGTGNPFKGYMAQFIYSDGQSYAPTTFGSTNANGIWVPITQPSVNYGNNGFKLDFAGTGTSADANGFGADSSGNNNHLATAGEGTNPSTTDTCQNNFATMNPLIGTQGQTPTYSKGNTIVTSTSNGSYGASALSTFAIDSGKWYWETKLTGDRNNGIAIGLAESTWAVGSATDSWFGGSNLNGYAFQYTNSGQKKVDDGTGTSYGSQIQVNDILGTAYDADNNTITWYINGSSQGQAFSSMRNITFVPASYGYYNTQWEFNFGNPAFTIASGNSDANGYGNFEYAVPSGYYALCTKNLALYGG